MIDFGKNIKILNYNESLIDKYKNKDNLLRHARYIPGKTEGIFLIDERNNSLVGYAAWEGDTLIALEIIKDYQSLGLGKKLLAFCEENGVRKLTVSRKNIPAISLYRKSGWKNSKKQENNKIFYMEKIYTVSLTESELKLFSEFLSQKEYARGVDNAVSSAKKMMRRSGQKKVNKAAKRAWIIKESGIPKYRSEGFRTVKTSPNEEKIAIMRVRRDLLESTIPGPEMPKKPYNVNQRINLRDYYTTEELKFSPEFSSKKKKRFTAC